MGGIPSGLLTHGARLTHLRPEDGARDVFSAAILHRCLPSEMHALQRSISVSIRVRPLTS